MALLEDILRQLQEFAPNLIFALAILFVGWMIAKLIANIIKRILKAIKIDDLADKLNDIDIVRQANMRILPSNVISKVIYYVFMLVTFIVATDKLGVAAVTDLLTDFIGYLPRLLTGLIFFVIGYWVPGTGSSISGFGIDCRILGTSFRS